MKVIFCDVDGAEELLIQEREDIVALLEMVKIKGEINIYKEDYDYFYGTFESFRLDFNKIEETGMFEEELRIFLKCIDAE